MPILSLRSQPRKIGVTDGRLGACPSSPNCVCSDHGNASHSIEPLRLAIRSGDLWSIVERTVRDLPGSHIVSIRADYLHAECRSRFFGFVDDLELHLRASEGIIAVRSASRLGYSDFGVNRRRIEKLRAMLHAQGVVR